MKKFVCPICGNSSLESIGYFNNTPYCRLCLPFQGKKADISYEVNKGISLSLSYHLSKKQETVANKVLSLIKEKKNVLIHAVTGAGKTELVYASMQEILNRGGHVGFATPRKDVVIDLLPRIQEAFPKAVVVAVYGEHNEKLNGDIILLTTHQLFRYKDYFDLIILDEIDAFPYKGSKVLKQFFYDSVKGNHILLSATPSKEDLEEIKERNGEVVELFSRYHNHPLPVPKLSLMPIYLMYFKIYHLIKHYQRENKPVFVFTPTIQDGKRLFSYLSLLLSDGAFVSSKEEERRLNIEKFKVRQLSYLVTTSILERGVTVKDLQVIVFKADHKVYDKSALIQIAGRVGRKIDAPKGEVYFLAQEENKEVSEAIYEIERYNRKAGLL